MPIGQYLNNILPSYPLTEHQLLVPMAQCHIDFNFTSTLSFLRSQVIARVFRNSQQVYKNKSDLVSRRADGPGSKVHQVHIHGHPQPIQVMLSVTGRTASSSVLW